MRVWVLEVPVDEARDRAQTKAKGSLWAAVAAATAAVVALWRKQQAATKVNSIYYACISNLKVEVDLS